MKDWRLKRCRRIFNVWFSFNKLTVRFADYTTTTLRRNRKHFMVYLIKILLRRVYFFFNLFSSVCRFQRYLVFVFEEWYEDHAECRLAGRRYLSKYLSTSIRMNRVIRVPEIIIQRGIKKKYFFVKEICKMIAVNVRRYIGTHKEPL